MINLLPPEIKEDIFYARRNTNIRKWIISSLFAIAGVGLIVCGGLLYMQKSISDYTKTVENSKASLQAQQVDQTQKRLEEISGSTKLATQVLSREILFSKLIRQIGRALPTNTALKSLQIDSAQGGIQLNAGATDFNAATQLQLNMQDPNNGVFEKADINSITCGGDPTKGLPCDVSLRALFSKNNSYLYIAPSAATGSNSGGTTR